MNFKDFKELKSLSDKGLQKELMETVKYKNASRFENKQGQLKDSSQLKKLRKHVARIKTLNQQRNP